MAILIDFSQNVIAATCAVAGNKRHGIDITVDVIRHITLDSIRQFRQRFKNQYGELIICVDSRSWRKDVFPYYKAARKIDRDNGFLPWDIIFEAMNVIKEELIEFFPYQVVQADGAEADDIIAILARELSHSGEKVMIVSSDKDFRQLQTYPNVRQYSPLQKKEIIEDEPLTYLKEHIIRGDKGDGVPNIRSADDVFVLGERQRVISAKFFDEHMGKRPESFSEDIKRNYDRNKKLVDLVDCVPADVQQRILESWENANVADRRGLLGYMASRRLKILIDRIGDF